MHLSKVAIWWSSLVVGLLLCGFACWAVWATLAPVDAGSATILPNPDPPWEEFGALVAVLGGLLAIAAETKDREMPFGVAAQGLWAGTILVIGLVFTYAKAEHDRQEHAAQERHLNKDSELLLSANDKASTLLHDMRVVNDSLRKSGEAIGASVAGVQTALGADDNTGLRGQIEKVRRAALTPENIAALVTPQIAEELSKKAAPLIARQFVLPDAKDIAGKIILPSASAIAGKIAPPSPEVIAKEMVTAHPVQIPELAKALVGAGFRAPSAQEIVTALKKSSALPGKEDVAQAVAAGLAGDLVAALKSGLGRDILASLAESPAACDALAEQMRLALSPEARKRIVDRLGG